MTAERARVDAAVQDLETVAPRTSPRGSLPIGTRDHRSPDECRRLQQAAGNLAVLQLLGQQGRVMSFVQRDGGGASPTPAPAPGVNPPSPPVPGSPEEARSDGLRSGAAYGTVLADIDAGLDVVRREWGGRSTWDEMKPEERNAWAQKAAQRFAQLPGGRTYDRPECVVAQDEGFRAGFGSAYELGRAASFMVKLGTDVAVVLIMTVAAAGVFSRFLARLLPTTRVVLGGEGETMTLYRYSKEAGSVRPDGWWTTRQAMSRADAARLTGVPESECLYEQSVTVNAHPSKYEAFFRSSTPRSVGESLVEEFRNKVLVPESVIKVTPMNK